MEGRGSVKSAGIDLPECTAAHPKKQPSSNFIYVDIRTICWKSGHVMYAE
jgi:hypothetical protein